MEKQADVPFFARFLEAQGGVKTGVRSGKATRPIAVTLKYPSDHEDGPPLTTLKYPSDQEG